MTSYIIIVIIIIIINIIIIIIITITITIIIRGHRSEDLAIRMGFRVNGQLE